MDREEELLRAWHPGFFKVSDPNHSLDTFFLDVLRSTQHRHSDLITEWAKAFLDSHPVPEQRTPESIKAWSDRIEWTHDEYGQEYAAIACRLAITIAAEEQRDLTNHQYLQARFPDLVDERTKIRIRSSWLKYAWSFCERVEAMTLDDRLSGTLVRLHDVYERGDEIVIDYDTMPPVVHGHMSTSDPRVLLKIKHIAEEIALDSKLQGKTDE